MLSYSQQGYLKLAIKKGIIVSIDEVENGLKCGCYCPKCGAPLVAKNEGTMKVHHFAHFSNLKCLGAIESALHILAKEILKETKTLFLPNYKYYFKEFDKEVVILPYNKLLEFDSVELEKKIQLDDSIIIADAVCEVNNKKIIVEFAKSHFIDEEKKRKLKDLGIACIEIPISNGEQNKTLLKEQLFSNYFQSDWIVNKKGEQQIEVFRNKLKAEWEKQLKAIQEDKEKQLKLRRESEEREKKLEEKIRRGKLREVEKKGTLVKDCPINKELRSLYAEMLLGSHDISPVLLNAKEVSDIYYRWPDFIDVFIDKVRIILRPPEYPNLSRDEQKEYDYLLFIVEKFKRLRNPQLKSLCTYCNLFRGTIYEFIICGYKEGVDIKNCLRF